MNALPMNLFSKYLFWLSVFTAVFVFVVWPRFAGSARFRGPRLSKEIETQMEKLAFAECSRQGLTVVGYDGADFSDRYWHISIVMASNAPSFLQKARMPPDFDYHVLRDGRAVYRGPGSK